MRSVSALVPTPLRLRNEGNRSTIHVCCSEKSVPASPTARRVHYEHQIRYLIPRFTRHCKYGVCYGKTISTRHLLNWTNFSELTAPEAREFLPPLHAQTIHFPSPAVYSIRMRGHSLRNRTALPSLFPPCNNKCTACHTLLLHLRSVWPQSTASVMPMWWIFLARATDDWQVTWSVQNITIP